jgi:hypothetical protein
MISSWQSLGFFDMSDLGIAPYFHACVRKLARDGRGGFQKKGCAGE